MDGYDGGRFLKRWIVAIFGLALLGLASLLLIIPRYHLQQQAMTMAREAAVRSNMRTMQVALESFMAEDGGGYPSLRTIGAAETAAPWGLDDDAFRRMVAHLRNPLDPGERAWRVSHRDPPFWPLFKPGQVVYVPLDAAGARARAFAVYGMGQAGPLKTVLRSQAFPDAGADLQEQQELGR